MKYCKKNQQTNPIQVLIILGICVLMKSAFSTLFFFLHPWQESRSKFKQLKIEHLAGPCQSAVRNEIWKLGRSSKRWSRPGSPAGPSTAPAEPRPSETCATFPGAAAAAQSAGSASSLALTAWWSWQLASLNFKPAFDPGCRRGERPPAYPPANS